MIPLPTGVRVWLATGCTDMRKGFPSLALQIQEILQRDPLSGHLFCFRGRRGNLLKVTWHDGQGRLLVHKSAWSGAGSCGRARLTACGDLIGIARLSVVWHRLAAPTGDLAANIRSADAFSLRMVMDVIPSSA
jgi:hypothetical protein